MNIKNKCRFLVCYWLHRFIWSYVQSLSTTEMGFGVCLTFGSIYIYIYIYIYMGHNHSSSVLNSRILRRKIFWAKIKICVIYWTWFLFELVVRQEVSISAKEAVMLTSISNEFCYFVYCTLLLWLFLDRRLSALSLGYQSFYIPYATFFAFSLEEWDSMNMWYSWERGELYTHTGFY